ncbi:uncharacterized protein J4E88_007984 [Alternaria novae-zelandiae]|uniref:uncharacterized protein n=1 Tax=Alternaria novae-zelandiae TaxID=430562 RepID=UPI0020C45D13|nr:uncharacterized protein J4E88_007984 [Alternaria novae-zelandiae]KAI4675080.1 hypothetical protein J4E88_007984 [Alternaria novae-zelandiae]
MTSHIPQPQSRLLQLPGEIRNEIYDYLVVRQRYIHFKRPTADANTATLRASNDQATLRIALGLVHTCRQLRKEFQPLHLKDVHATVNIPDINEFIADFIPIPATCTNTLYIRIPRSYYTVNLMPLLRFQSAATSVKINLLDPYRAPDGFDIVHDDRDEDPHYRFFCFLTAVLAALERTAAWRTYFRDAIVDITVDHAEHFSWTIKVKKDAKEDWMPWNAATSRESSSRQHRAAASMWRMRIGMGHIIMPNVVVASD